MQVGLDYNWSVIAAGYGSSYALKRDGSLWEWRGNNFDQFSDGTAWETEPVQIIDPDFYIVTPSADDHGSISPDTPQSVDYSNTTSFALTPDIGYGIDKVEGCGGTLSGNIYITDTVTADCEVNATFVINTYMVTPSAGANGGISPDTQQSVNYSNTTQLHPDIGHRLRR